MLREGNEFTLEELAAEIGVSRQMVWNWENHINEPGGKNLSKLAGFFKVSANLLKNNSEPMDSGIMSIIKINKSTEDKRRIEDGTALMPDVYYNQFKELQEERDALKDKLLLQHEKYQALFEKYAAVKEELDVFKNRTGTN